MTDLISEGGGRRVLQREQVVMALVEGATYAEAGSRATPPVTSRTVARWMSEVEMAHRVSELRGEQVRVLTGLLTVLARQGMEVIRSAFNADRTADQLRAVDLALRLSLRYRESVELEGRVAELESRVNTQGATPGEVA